MTNRNKVVGFLLVSRSAGSTHLQHVQYKGEASKSLPRKPLSDVTGGLSISTDIVYDFDQLISQLSY